MSRLKEVGGEVINHNSFVGVQMKQAAQRKYLITLYIINTSFKIHVPVLDQDFIYNDVPRLHNVACLSALR